MSDHFDILGVSSKGKNNELDNLTSFEGVPSHAIEMTRKITPLKDIAAVYELYKLFKKEKTFYSALSYAKSWYFINVSGQISRSTT